MHDPANHTAFRVLGAHSWLALVLALVVAATYHLASELLLRHMEDEARSLCQSLVHRIESRLAPIERVPKGLAYELEDGKLSDADIRRRQRRILADNDEIFGTAVAILTSVFPPEKRGRAIGWVSASVYIGLSLGPPLGGLLVLRI